MSTCTRAHLRSNIIGYVALFLALTGGVAWANHPGGADTISSGDIINNEVKSVDLANGEVKTDDLAANSVGSNKIVDQTVKNADLSIGASSSNTIADGGIQGVDVKNNTLTGAQVDESTLFNDNSLTGADVDESTLAGVPSAPTGAAGGDLDGTYPNPVIADAAVTIPKLDFDPATQAELADHVGSADHDFRYWKLDGNSATEPGQFLGTTDNQPLNLRVNNARGLRLEPASDGTNQSPNVIGGIADNSVAAGVHSATIAGGGRAEPADPFSASRVTDSFGTIGGGAHNRAGNFDGDPLTARYATVGGGFNGTATGFGATVSGGLANSATGARATVSGGQGNMASADAAMVPGGTANTAAGQQSLAAGNQAKANHRGAFVWADFSPFDFASTAQNQFNVRSTGGARLVSGIDGAGNATSGLELPAGVSGWSTLVNGQPFDIRVNDARGLRIEPAFDGINQSPNVIGGIADNSVAVDVFAATIAGGGRSDPADPATANRVTDHYGTVGGGGRNQAGNGGDAGDVRFTTVGGGGGNTASGPFATAGGGLNNTAGAFASTVGGGSGNNVSGFGATVGGGRSNAASALDATVGGGNSNNAGANDATVGGGLGNIASGQEATVAGGLGNTASGLDATVAGGLSNTASGDRATVAGGLLNAAAGDSSFVAGRQATNADLTHDGVFLFADATGDGTTATNFESAAANEFAARASGGFRFRTSADLTTGCDLPAGSGTFTCTSDRQAKTGFAGVNTRAVLARLVGLPIETWTYRADPARVRHMGPTAQAFKRAFGVGEDPRTISAVDADGVALAAIKGLNEKVQRLQRTVTSLRQLAGAGR